MDDYKTQRADSRRIQEERNKKQRTEVTKKAAALAAKKREKKEREKKRRQDWKQDTCIGSIKEFIKQLGECFKKIDRWAVDNCCCGQRWWSKFLCIIGLTIIETTLSPALLPVKIVCAGVVTLYLMVTRNSNRPSTAAVTAATGEIAEEIQAELNVGDFLEPMMENVGDFLE